MAERPAGQRQQPPRLPLREILALATDEVSALIGRPVEGVSAVDRVDHGFQLAIEVVELTRIPDTTSVLATYEVDVDDSGQLRSYRRLRRYNRASTETS